ncbi:hypothetical protein [Propioniciclava soli]|uniref:hypothetical protein n=1 Tax=Propioniciclava soli TaxID=2775081 RepID=UPI001E3C2EC3|nr:hypothetical protein [Propioniciclava soli]
MDTMLVDCNACSARGPACSGCVVSVLLGSPGQAADALAADEVDALDALAGGGLLPPLRLVHPVASDPPERWPRPAEARSRRRHRA